MSPGSINNLRLQSKDALFQALIYLPNSSFGGPDLHLKCYAYKRLDVCNSGGLSLQGTDIWH